MKILTALLLVLSLALILGGCENHQMTADEYYNTVHPQSPVSMPRSGVFIGTLLQKTVNRVDIGQSGWIDERKVTVYRADACAIPGETLVYTQQDTQHRIRFCVTEGVKYRLEVPEGVHDLQCPFSDAKELTKAEADKLIFIDEMAVVPK